MNTKEFSQRFDSLLNSQKDYKSYGGTLGHVLTLNEYEKSEKLLKEYNDDIFKNRQGLEHPTALFYYGISKYEQKKWEEAITEFDKALKVYPNLSDAKLIISTSGINRYSLISCPSICN